VNTCPTTINGGSQEGLQKECERAADYQSGEDHVDILLEVDDEPV
jgi:hypothetical protein